MGVAAIQNACLAGAMAGLLSGRFVGSFVALDYAALALASRAIADEFIVQNTASGSPLADGDNGNITILVQSVAQAALVNSGAVSVLPADYPKYGKQIYAASKEGLTKLS